MKDIQQTIQSLLDQFVAEDSERGLQVAVYLYGELVVDASAGIANPATGLAVDATTLFPVFSTTKGIAATLAHLLVERGKISYDTHLADVWPEFGAQGKGGITLRHALNHTAGLSHMPLNLGHAELCDWKTMCAAMASQEPISPPGVEMTYHAITYSWLVGEPLCRVDGRSFAQLLHDEICVPLGLANELFVGIPDAIEARVAILEDQFDMSAQAPLPNDASPQAIPALVLPLYAWMNRSDARRACIPASNGIMTARAIAKHYAALLPGGVDGIELLPPERIRLALESQTVSRSVPPEMLARMRLGYGYGHSSLSAFGHGGAGGSLGYADPESGLAFGFTRNRFVSKTTLSQIDEALKRALQG
jgi:CubicO group peptidase (beta-lactamase class C family)